MKLAISLTLILCLAAVILASLAKRTMDSATRAIGTVVTAPGTASNHK